MQSVDAVIRFLTGLFAGTGLTEDTVITVGAAVALVVVILCVVFALSRRIDRLEESLMDLRQLHSTMHETQADHARVVSALESFASALPDLEAFTQHLSRANSQQSELVGAVARVSIDLESVRESVANIKSESMTLHELMENSHACVEMMQVKLGSLQTIQNEQHKIYRILKAWDTRFKDMERVVAAVPSIQAGQARVQKELAEWTSRFNAASEVLAELPQAEHPTSERVPAPNAPIGP